MTNGRVNKMVKNILNLVVIMFVEKTPLMSPVIFSVSVTFQ